MKPRIGDRRAIAVAAVALAASSVMTGACRKEKESLIEFALTSDARASDVRSLVLVAGNITQMFSAPAGLSPTPSYFGVYVPSSLTGMVALSVDATPETGCVGYHGNGSVLIAAAGDTVTAPIMLRAVNRCLDGGTDVGGQVGQGGTSGGLGGAGGGQGGVTGQGGSAGGGQGGSNGGGQGGGAGGQGGGVGGRGGMAGGTGGAAGAGAGGAAGSSGPNLATCTEIDHADTPSCASICPTAVDSIVYGAEFSPNGQLLVTGGSDGRVKVWRVSGQTLTPEGHVLTGAGFGVLAFSPSGTMLAVGRIGGIELWDVSTWTLLRTLTVASKVYGVGFAPGGTKVVSLDKDVTRAAPNSTLYVHSVGLLAAASSVNLNLGFALAVSPAMAGTTAPVAVTTEDGKVLVYTLTNSTFAGPTTFTVTSDASIAETAVFSRQGTLLAAGGDDGILHLWNVSPLGVSSPDVDFTGAFAGYSSWVTALAFTSNGSYVAVGGGFFGVIGAWSTAPPRAQVGTTYTNGNYDLASLAFSPDGRLLVGGEFSCGCVIVCPQ